MIRGAGARAPPTILLPLSLQFLEQVLRVECDRFFRQQPPVLLAEAFLRVVALLVLDIRSYAGHVPARYMEGPVAHLPLETRAGEALLVDPPRRVGFDHPHHIGQLPIGVVLEEYVQVVGHRVDLQQAQPLVGEDAADVAVQVVAPVGQDQRLAVLHRRNDVDGHLCVRVSHSVVLAEAPLAGRVCHGVLHRFLGDYSHRMVGFPSSPGQGPALQKARSDGARWGVPTITALVNLSVWECAYRQACYASC